MMRLKEDLEEECRQKTNHDFYVRECRWCHAVDFPENAKGMARREGGAE